MVRYLVRAVLVLAVAACAVLAVGFGLAVADDFSRRGLIPPGVTVEGVPIGSLTATAATEVLTAEFVAPQADDVVLARAAGWSFRLEVSEFYQVDIEGMVRDALALRERRTAWERLSWRLLDETLDVDLPLRRRVDEHAVKEWVAGIAADVDLAAIDATRGVTPEGFLVVAAEPGRRLEVARGAALVRDIVLAGGTVVALPVAVVEPATTGEDLGMAIHVDLSERRLYLYEGAKLVKEYGVAIGTPGYSTPRGEWEIVQKRYMPSWGNPGSSWAASMPAYIPPGPSNPLGTRALYLSVSGIRIHGTTQDWSIGRAASHGCMRMHRWDVEDLYDRVDVGTPVIITS